MVEPKSTFTYDALYRLTKAEGREHLSLNNPVIANYDIEKYCYAFDNTNSNDLQALANYERNYQYDKNNNLTQIQHQTLGAGNTARNFTRDIDIAAGSNRAVPNDMLGSNTVDDFFDANGNCTNLDHLETIEYNYRDNISKVKKNGVTDYEYYIYNSAGDRVRKISVVGGVETHKVYLGGVEITRVYEPAGSLKLERWDCHVMDDTSRIAIVNTWTINTLPGTDNPPAGTTKTRYQYGNHLGSASLELDHEGNVISYEEYFPYGGSAFMYGENLAEVKRKEYRFTGKERDEFTGLYYFGVRYYAPWIGRWMSADPKRENSDGLNLYAYVRNNPVTLVDPNGEQSINPLAVPTFRALKAIPRMAADFIGGAVDATIKGGKAVANYLNSSGLDPQKRREAQQPLKDEIKQWQTDPKEAVKDVKQAAVNIKEGAKDYVKNFSARDAGGLAATVGAEILVGKGLGALSKAGKAKALTHLDDAKDLNKVKRLGDVEGTKLDFSDQISNPIPDRGARVIPSEYLDDATNLSYEGASEAWVTAADDVAGISSSEGLAKKLTLLDENGDLISEPLSVIEFDLPTDKIASPINRNNPGFVSPGTGKTAGGAREFVTPNYSLDELKNVKKRDVD